MHFSSCKEFVLINTACDSIGHVLHSNKADLEKICLMNERESDCSFCQMSPFQAGAFAG